MMAKTMVTPAMIALTVSMVAKTLPAKDSATMDSAKAPIHLMISTESYLNRLVGLTAGVSSPAGAGVSTTGGSSVTTVEVVNPLASLAAVIV